MYIYIYIIEINNLQEKSSFKKKKKSRFDHVLHFILLSIFDFFSFVNPTFDEHTTNRKIIIKEKKKKFKQTFYKHTFL
jgi:hypothetical protein